MIKIVLHGQKLSVTVAGPNHVSRLAGTQQIDRSWLPFIGSKVSRKSGHGEHACANSLARQLVHQYMYRQSNGPCSPADFLVHLGSSFRAMQGTLLELLHARTTGSRLFCLNCKL